MSARLPSAARASAKTAGGEPPSAVVSASADGVPAPPIDWPRALLLPAWGARLRWGMASSEVSGAAADTMPAVELASERLALADEAVLQGVALTATLVFELDRLVRVELAGAIDVLALAALGCDNDTLDDVAHHRLAIGRTRVTVDALDGVIALEPDEDP